MTMTAQSRRERAGCDARRRQADHTRNAIVHNGVLDPGVHMIGKPFNLEQLARKLAELKGLKDA